MPRKARVAPGGLVYHVLNRAAGRMTLFRNEKDFAAFERVMLEAHERFSLRILAYCILSNHWHFIVWPEDDGDLTAFFRWLANTHAMRWRVAHQAAGLGPLYQGRFKSFPIQRDGHLLTACRHVEHNALAAGRVKRAQDWRWGSLWARANGTDGLKRLLSDWPVDRPRDWVQTVNTPLSAREMEKWKAAEARGRPFGTDQWIQRTVKTLGLEHTIRRQGRPEKPKKTAER